MHCSCPCALPSRLKSVKYCTKPRSNAQIMGKTILTIGYFNKNGERKDISGEVHSGQENGSLQIVESTSWRPKYSKLRKEYTALKEPTRRDAVEMASSLLNREMRQSCSNLDWKHPEKGKFVIKNSNTTGRAWVMSRMTWSGCRGENRGERRNGSERSCECT